VQIYKVRAFVILIKLKPSTFYQICDKGMTNS
jgi:hypothetical protein